MDTIYIIILSVFALMLIIGIIRVILNPSDSIGGFILEMFLLDITWDFLCALFSAIGDSISDSSDW